MLRAGDLVAGQQVQRAAAGPAAPAVTVVMPTWSRATGGRLERALKSVVEQSFEDWELVVVDDGSTDGTRDVVRELQRRDPRLVYVRHERNCGLPALRVNEGIELARARWVAFQFDDDAWTPAALSSLVAVARAQPEPAVVFGSARLRFPDGSELVLPEAPVDMLTLSFRNRIANNAVLVPRELFARHGLYDPHVAMRRLTDWDLWLRLARFAPFVGVDELVSEVSVLADEASLGAAFPVDLPLFRFLQAIPRNRLLQPERWRDYAVDATSIAGVEVAGPLRTRLDEQHLLPFRRRLGGSFPGLGGDEAAAATPSAPASTPRPLLVTMDSFYPSFEMCAGHYDMRASSHGLPKMHYRPLLELDAGWAAENELLLMVRTTLESGVRVLREALAAGVPAGYYLDDDLLHLYEYGKDFDVLAPGGDRYRWLQTQLAEADAVWVTSPVIAESVAPWNPRLVPHNGAIRESWLPSRLHPRGGEDGVIRIGYTGAGYRVEEFAAMWGALERFSRELGHRVEFEFWGVDPTELPALASPTTFRPFMHGFGEFVSRLLRTRLDVQLVPLLDRPRPRRAKAPSRHYYVAMTGSLGIFSDIDVYADLPAGVTCLKVKGESAEPWYAALREAIEMPAERFDAMRRAAVEHVRLEYTEGAEIHLHEAAVRATAFHAATRGRRVGGRPPVLSVFAADAPSEDDEQLLRAALVARGYGVEARALCAGDAIALQARCDRLGVPWQAVARGLLSASAPWMDPTPLYALLRTQTPALVQASGDVPALRAACHDLGVAWVGEPGRASVRGEVFRGGLQRVLVREAEVEHPSGDAAGGPLVAMIADFAEAAAQLQAIEALAAKAAASGWKLKLWGSMAVEPRYANRCRRRVHELGLQERVELLRPLEDESAMLAGVDLLLDLGRSERMPAAVTLAVAAGVPVLSSSPGTFAGALRNGETAWRLPVPSPAADELAAAVARTLALPRDVHHAVAKAAYRWARGDLHPQRAASELMAGYLSALGRDPWTRSAAPPIAAVTPSTAVAPAAAAAPANPPASIASPPSTRERLRRLSQEIGLYRPLSRLYWRARRRRVLVVAENPNLSLHLYYWLALPALEAASRRSWIIASAADVRADDLHSYAAVVFVRATSAKSLELLRAARRAGCRTIYDADDHLLLLHQAIADADNPWRRTFDAAAPEIAALLAEADLVKLYTPAAAPFFREHNPRLAWVRAFQPASPPQATAPPRPLPHPRPLKVGFLGSAFKDEELRPVVAATLRLLDAERDLAFEVFGFLPAALREEPRVSWVPLVTPWEAFRATLHELEWDVGLAPLRDLSFNRCKNELKYREYGSAGIAGVYADMPVYAGAVRHRATGLLVPHEDERAWEEAIRELLRDDALRSAIQRNADEDVRANYRVETYAAQVARLLEGEWEPPPAAPA